MTEEIQEQDPFSQLDEMIQEDQSLKQLRYTHKNPSFNEILLIFSTIFIIFLTIIIGGIVYDVVYSQGFNKMTIVEIVLTTFFFLVVVFIQWLYLCPGKLTMNQDGIYFDKWSGILPWSSISQIKYNVKRLWTSRRLDCAYIGLVLKFYIYNNSEKTRLIRLCFYTVKEAEECLVFLRSYSAYKDFKVQRDNSYWSFWSSWLFKR